MGSTTGEPWLFLIHQLPPKPSYLRVKVWRRLLAIGAVPIKNSVYVLPASDQSREHFEWMIREIEKEGGEAALCEAHLLDGLTDSQVLSSFQTARDADYSEIAAVARRLERELSRKRPVPVKRRVQLEAELARLTRRIADVSAIDFFGAPGRESAEGLVSGVAQLLRGALRGDEGSHRHVSRLDLRGKVWVTRKGIHVDRIASGWLIRRFVDSAARFKFVTSKVYEPGHGELRFDMFEAEFTHEGDHCTFEVLMDRLGLDDPALAQIAEIIHDIDLRDDKFNRPETPGIDHLIAGLAMAHGEDEARLEHGSVVFEGLYRFFTRKKA